jgi:hypothetical protein
MITASRWNSPATPTNGSVWENLALASTNIVTKAVALSNEYTSYRRPWPRASTT